MVKDKNKQHTLAVAIQFQGKGLHTNVKSNVHILPAESNTGIRFVRVDLEDKPIIKADCDFVSSTERSTTLTKGDASVITVEHLLAALSGCFIDNAIIEIDGPELPILDGSALPFVEAIQKVGIQEQSTEKIWWDINEVLTIKDEDKQSELVLVPSSFYRLSTIIGFSGKSIDLQYATLGDIDNFIEEVAPARTFCFLSEVKALFEQGIIKGGDTDNALIIIDEHLTEDVKEKIDCQEPYDNGDFHSHRPALFKNEPARHKLLDIVGDLSLCGYAFKGHIIGNKPGHKTNVALAKRIKQFIKSQEQRFDYSQYLLKDAIYGLPAISKFLPHRYPFLLVDKIVEKTENSIISIKNVTINEPFFEGHFPGNPVMPGVLIVEALAQTGGIFVLTQQENPEGYDTYFLKIDQCRFKRKVCPGDSLIIHMELIHATKRGIFEMRGKAYVKDSLCCEAILLAQIIRTKNRTDV